MTDRKRRTSAAKSNHSAPPVRSPILGNETLDGRNLADVAYDRIETAIVHLELRPGMFLTIADIQERVGLGRTPVLEAIRKLADDTLLTVLSRRGLRVSPIRLDREQHLLALRRDVERFAVKLAAERATPVQRSQMHQIVRALRSENGNLSVLAFNELDQRLDKLILEAAAEPFAERVLRPLHAIFRRLGYIYLAHLDDGSAFAASVERHSALLTTVAEGKVLEAVAISDAIIELSGSMFDSLANEIDPSLLDASITPLSIK